MAIRDIFTRLLIMSFLAAGAFAGDFVPGGRNTRGRVTVDGRAVLTDWGTRLRGTCWCQDCHTGLFKKEELRTMKLCGLNALHVYGEKNDDKPVGCEAANIDSIVEWCRQESMYVVITFGNSHLPSYEKVLNFWRFYAPRYKDMSHVIYEEKNEGCYGTYHCDDVAMQFYRDAYQIIREVAPETHVMLMSHSNLKGGVNSLWEDVDRLSDIVDWGNASFAFHGYSPSVGEQVQMIEALGADGYAMTCTEYPSFPAADLNLARAYEDAGISYFHFRSCWWWESINTICGLVRNMGKSWQPDFGDWPQPHVEHTPVAAYSTRPRTETAGQAGPGVCRLAIGARLCGQAHAVYDVKGRTVWRSAGEAGGWASIARSLGTQVYLVEEAQEKRQ